MCYGIPHKAAIKGYRLKDTHRNLYFDGHYWTPDPSAAKEYKTQAEAESAKLPFNYHEVVEEIR